MANNEKVRALRPRTPASKIFDFFKETEVFQVAGPGGEKFPVLFRSLDYGQNAALVQEMDIIRSSIKHDLEADDLRAGLLDQAIRLTRESLYAAILNLERPLAVEQADLAPGADPGAVDAAKKEAEAAAKWETMRQAELNDMDDKDLRTIVVDRQTRLLVNSRLLGEFMNSSLVHMVLNPETKQPLFSMDAMECQECGHRMRELSATTQVHCEQPMEIVENFIGRLAPQIRDQLVDFRRQFTMRKDEKETRKVADAPVFLPSGGSPKEPDDSPGATIEIPSSSPRTSSSAMPNDLGSTI